VFDWTGLFLLNIAAWLATSVLLYTSVRRANVSPPTAPVGALALALAGFSVEYAVVAWSK